jgi:hypothetical protein
LHACAQIEFCVIRQNHGSLYPYVPNEVVALFSVVQLLHSIQLLDFTV